MASLLQRLLLLMLGLVGLGSARLFRDDTPQLPHDPNTSPHCTWWLDYDGTETCEEILDWNMITMAQFVRWVSGVPGFVIDQELTFMTESVSLAELWRSHRRTQLLR